MKNPLRVVWLLALPVIVSASTQDVNKLPDNPPIPMVRFECVWEAATPQDFAVLVKNTGAASYLSRNPTRPESPEPASRNPYLPDYKIEFTLSPASLSKIFKLATQANYFKGDFDYKKHAMANTGSKTLGYADANRRNETTYNWSENTAIDQLTQLFQGISATIEHGRKLNYLHRYDKLGLEDELKFMEDAAQNHQLAEIQLIRPILSSIVADSGVLNIARQRARRLLDVASKELGESAGVKAAQ